MYSTGDVRGEVRGQLQPDVGHSSENRKSRRVFDSNQNSETKVYF